MNVVDPDLDRRTSRAAVDRLIREHGNIEMLLLMLDSYFAAMNAGEEVDEALLLDAMTYMTDFVDAFHHAKEQLAVDTVASRAPKVATARAELGAQHRRISEMGAWLRATLEGVLRDEPVSRAKLVGVGLAYTAEMRRNMELEETVVFPALVEALDANAWRLIEAKIGPQPDPLFGEAVHQRYAELFRELAARFGCEDEARWD